MAFWVYILECADGSYYVGHTDNLEERVAQHQSGAIKGYAHSRRPVRLVFSDTSPTRLEALEALEAERRLKGWGRAKKKALITGDWRQISALGRKRFQRQD